MSVRTVKSVERGALEHAQELLEADVTKCPAD
jgi:hypothetical protein